MKVETDRCHLALPFRVRFTFVLQSLQYVLKGHFWSNRPQIGDDRLALRELSYPISENALIKEQLSGEWRATMSYH
jgi:hypothetical protein